MPDASVLEFDAVAIAECQACGREFTLATKRQYCCPVEWSTVECGSSVSDSWIHVLESRFGIQPETTDVRDDSFCRVAFGSDCDDLYSAQIDFRDLERSNNCLSR